MASVEQKIYVLTIPKCGSSALKQMSGFRFTVNWVKEPGWTTLVVLRDPFERVVSGLQQMARGRQKDPRRVAEGFVDSVERRLLWVDDYEDPHLFPQAWYLPPWNPVDFVARFEDLSCFPEILSQHFDLRIDLLPVENVSSLTTSEEVRQILLPFRDKIYNIYYSYRCLMSYFESEAKVLTV